MKFELADGTQVIIETDAGPEPTGPRPASRVDAAVAGVHRSFEQALSSVKQTVAAAVRELRDAFPDAPDELELEFGIKASLEANGLILAKAAGEAIFSVKAIWKKPAET